MKDSWVPSHEPENRDGEAQKLLPIGEGLGCEEAFRGPFNGVFEKTSGFELGFLVDYVVKASVLDPFEADFGYASPLMEMVRERVKLGGFIWEIFKE